MNMVTLAYTNTGAYINIYLRLYTNLTGVYTLRLCVNE